MASKNNWFTTNINKRTIDNLEDFEIKIAPYEFVDRGFYKNCELLAVELYEKYKNLHLCYSGGSDSEFVLKTFTDLGLSITPVIILTPYNHRESSYAFKYCKENNIKFEVLEYSSEDAIQKMKEKTLGKGLFSLLGGMPMMICDEVNKAGGKLLTGYGDPFSILPAVVPNHNISTTLEFSEWDYYLDAYDDSHPSGFFTYDLAVLYSLINEISYTEQISIAKCNLYKVEPRIKLFYDEELYKTFREMKNEKINKYNYFIEKNTLFNVLNNYKNNPAPINNNPIKEIL